MYWYTASCCNKSWSLTSRTSDPLCGTLKRCNRHVVCPANTADMNQLAFSEINTWCYQIQSHSGQGSILKIKISPQAMKDLLRREASLRPPSATMAPADILFHRLNILFHNGEERFLTVTQETKRVRYILSNTVTFMSAKITPTKQSACWFTCKFPRHRDRQGRKEYGYHGTPKTEWNRVHLYCCSNKLHTHVQCGKVEDVSQSVGSPVLVQIPLVYVKHYTTSSCHVTDGKFVSSA
jgi:hypothetical protein